MIEVGSKLYGYCHGVFGRDGYGPKIVIALGQRWVVVAECGDETDTFNSAVNIDVQEVLADCLEEE